MFLHCSSLSRGPPWGAEPGFELWPAIQQADALLSELRRTLLFKVIIDVTIVRHQTSAFFLRAIKFVKVRNILL